MKAALKLSAYQARAGMVGALLSCMCLFPIEKAETSTGHTSWCPAHAMTCTPDERSSLPPPFEWRAAGGGMLGKCRTCHAEVSATTMDALAFVMARDHKHEATS